MGFLPPGFESYLCLSMLESCLQIAASLVKECQRNMGIHGLLVQAFAGQDGPLFEIITVLGGETGQEIASVECQQALLALQAGQAALKIAVAVCIADMGQGFSLTHICPDTCLRMELDILRADEQQIFPAEGLFEIRKRLAQTLAGTFIILIRPKQGRETLAAVRPVALDRQVGQKGAYFVGGKPVQGLTIEFYLESAEQSKQECGHGEIVKVCIIILKISGFDAILTRICYNKSMTTTYRSYLLRLWLESNDPPVWRAILESPVNGERHGFSDLQALLTFIEKDALQLSEEAGSTDSPNY